MAPHQLVAGLVGDPSCRASAPIIDRLKDQGHAEPRAAGRRMSGTCWASEVSSETRQELVAQAKEWGQTGWASETSSKTADKRVGEMAALIVATREYQFA